MGEERTFFSFSSSFFPHFAAASLLSPSLGTLPPPLPLSFFLGSDGREFFSPLFFHSLLHSHNAPARLHYYSVQWRERQFRIWDTSVWTFSLCRSISLAASGEDKFFKTKSLP